MYKVKQITFGDEIRVRRSFYYHHGIYVSDDVVIHFAPQDDSHELNPESAVVCVTTLKNFSKNSQVEVREYTEEEKKKKRNNQDIVNYAFLQLGRKGYNILTNNCEHFSNECVFGKKESKQIDTIKNIFK